MRTRVGWYLLALLVGLAGSARAQSTPTVDQLMKQLTPNGGSATRGIRPSPGPSAPASPGMTSPSPSAPQGAIAAPPASATAQPRVAAAEKPSVDLNVQFANGSAVLTPAAENLLDVLGKALISAQLAGSHFRVEGHTDTTGSRALNQSLSARRAEAVVQYLHVKFGVAPERLQPLGKGQDDLLVPTPDQTPEPRNRRVHVVNLDG